MTSKLVKIIKEYPWLIFAILIGITLFIYTIPKLPESLDKDCLAERLCWDNGYEFQYHDWFNKKVRCYEINEKGWKEAREFINVNYEELDNKYVCKGG